MTISRRGDATYTGYNGAREAALRAMDKVKKSDASLQYRKYSDSQQVMRECIYMGVCPFCGDVFKNLAAHTNRPHGIDRFELKEMAGIPKSLPACSREFTESRSAAAKANLDKDHIRRLIAAPKPKKRTYSEAGKAVQRAKLHHPNVIANRRLPGRGFPSKSPEEMAEYAKRAGETNSRRRLARVADRDALIVERISGGELLEDVAADLGIHVRTAKTVLRRNGFDVDLRAQAARHDRRKAKSKASLAAAALARAKNLEQMRVERHARWAELGRTWSAIEVLATEWGVTEKTVIAYLKGSGETVPDGHQVGRRRPAKEAAPRLQRWDELGKDWNAVLLMSSELGLRPAQLSQYLRNLGEVVPDGRKAAR
ncbi:hypothetical protein SEA_MINNIE_51 [Mycobacterium phage Minnie]|uniref:Uncharacterized protein n=1 Tax=Mycobacterium phage Minnie TaxID=2653764 RepID=A0A5Q2WM87_9CAUD|nr:hypothetical protein I5H65_gp051 [Mycobacterium phage Minnie]QGH79622.1 hypothetical protein SEA_MINNIE_51 [Mycobacterium phage Minnie]